MRRNMLLSGCGARGRAFGRSVGGVAGVRDAAAASEMSCRCVRNLHSVRPEGRLGWWPAVRCSADHPFSIVRDEGTDDQKEPYHEVMYRSITS